MSMISVAENSSYLADKADVESRASVSTDAQFFGLKAKRSHKAKGGRRGGQGRRKPRSNRRRRRRSLSARLSNPSYRIKPSTLNCLAEQPHDLQPSRLGSATARTGTGVLTISKLRGRVTFWNDLQTTYFQRLDTSKIDSIVETLRGRDQSTFYNSNLVGDLNCFETSVLVAANQDLRDDSFQSKYLDEFFSFYGFYQDVINELQDNCSYQDDSEVAILQASHVIDQHFKVRKPRQVEETLGLKARDADDDEIADKIRLFDYQMESVQENDTYSTHYFFNQVDGQVPSKEVEDQLEWLEKELQIVERQVDSHVSNLTEKIKVLQKVEERKDNRLSSASNHKRMSEHFSQAILYMNIMQVAESIERVKAVRQSTQLTPQSISDKKAQMSHVPLILRRAYQNLIQEARTSSNKNIIPFNGKEFMLSFDPCVGLKDMWVDAALFYLLNDLRSDMARRQNYGRGLPIQLSVCYSATPNYNINFDIDYQKTEVEKKLQPATKQRAQKKVEEESKDNIFSELDLGELQSMQVKYGHEAENLRFCHHCKQFKRMVIFAKCSFQSSRHKMIYPTSTQVNGVKIYNAEGHRTKTMDCLALKKLVKDKKRRRTYEEQLQIACDQYYCSLCLKNFYDTCMEDVRANPDWICPYCTGACFCTRCRRMEQLTTAQAYLVSLNLNELLLTPRAVNKVFELDYQRSTSEIDCYAKTAFERVIRTCDLTQASQARVNANPKFAEQLSQQNRHHTHYFLEASLSTSGHINQIMSQYASSRSKTTGGGVKADQEKPQSITEINAAPVLKEVTRLRKRLHQEFQAMCSEEWAFCGTSLSKGAMFVDQVGPIIMEDSISEMQDSEEGSASAAAMELASMDELALSYGQLIKNSQTLAKKTITPQKTPMSMTALKMQSASTKVATSAKDNNRMSKRVQRIQIAEVKDFQVPLSKQKLRNNSKGVVGRNGGSSGVNGSSTLANLPELLTPLRVQSHHSTGSTSPSQGSKYATSTSAQRGVTRGVAAPKSKTTNILGMSTVDK